MEVAISYRKYYAGHKELSAVFYELFWIYVICGISGFCIESVWCWIDFQEFTSRTSNLFFPISCVWGIGGILLYLCTKKNRWDHWTYLFIKCMVLGAAFEYFCGCLGEQILEVTFWDYSGIPFHIGKYINLPFCAVWGVAGVFWVKKAYPYLKSKMMKKMSQTMKFGSRIFLIFIVTTQVITGAALVRMHERQEGIKPSNQMEYMLDGCFTDQVLQNYFPKMKNVYTGEKIYQKTEEITVSGNIPET